MSRPSVLTSIPRGFYIGAASSLKKTNQNTFQLAIITARNYEPMVEFGSVRNNPIILTEPQVRYLAEVIPHMCQSLCINKSTTFKDGDLRLTTTGSI
jgi:hypothetical protein